MRFHKHLPFANVSLPIISAESGNGKSSFIKQLITHCHPGTYIFNFLWSFPRSLIIHTQPHTQAYLSLGISVFVHTAEPSDFQNISRISFLPDDFTVDKNNFSSIPENSIVVLDDFAFKVANNIQEKVNFRAVVNYILRHKKITLILIIHNLFGNNLSTDILSAPHLFFSYSNMGYSIMRWDTLFLLFITHIQYNIFYLFQQNISKIGRSWSLRILSKCSKSEFSFCLRELGTKLYHK